jgi:hypothetical protein
VTPPLYASDDDQLVRQLIAENPWATIVSFTPAGLVASHYPVLLNDGSQLALLMHVDRPDEETHGFGSSEVLVIIAGAHGYISPSWYTVDATPVPTWNFIVAHCYGTPQGQLSARTGDPHGTAGECARARIEHHDRRVLGRAGVQSCRRARSAGRFGRAACACGALAGVRPDGVHRGCLQGVRPR